MVIPFYGLLFFICYLSIIWYFNALFIRRLKGIAVEKRKYAKWLALANIFLASGDSVLFFSLLISFVQDAAPCEFSVFYLTFFSSLPGEQFLTLSGGIFATSITMSFYYLFLGFYIRDKFRGGRNSLIIPASYVLFAARILLLFNPENIWLASCLPEQVPNYSAWLRNAPFFAYGIVTILMLAGNTLAAKIDISDADGSKISKYMLIIAASLLCSFFFYGLDIFFSHSLPEMAIWLTYIIKTIAYIVAAITMWRMEFKIPLPSKATV
jgi:hypothetical protein